ncbi:MAG: DUF362 domain-containing protein [Verrucomicrobia bacterium]|jgi:uncharacterized protein (DUF362 family)|nr:DUF362 domain-containing protein [Verrucomicrobiota bacterium]
MSEPPSTPPPENADAVSRREFLIRIGAAGSLIAGAAVGGYALWEPNHFVPGFEEGAGLELPSYAVDSHQLLPSLAIAHGQTHEPAIRAALAALGGMERFIRRGDVVLIKPNVAFDRPPALAATTHPEALRALAKLVIEAGAAQVMIADNPINSPSGCFLKSGLQQVAAELNLDLLYPEANSFAPLQLAGEVLKHWTFFHQPFRKATKVIGLAPCKDHNLCHASMTMKNWYGLLGGRRNQFHQHIHSIVSDFALMMKPTLVVLDGMNVLMKNGPTGGRLSDVKPMGTIVAGTDMVAVDSYGYTHLLGRDLAELTYLHKAHDRGLGNLNWKQTHYQEVQA